MTTTTLVPSATADADAELLVLGQTGTRHGRHDDLPSSVGEDGEV